MARHRPVGRFRRALADHDLRGDVGFTASAAARPRHAQRPPGPQAGGQLAPQRAAALHVQCLVDGLVADAHRLIAGKVEPQPLGDVLRAPRPGPLPVLPMPLPAALPGHDRPADGNSARGGNHAGQPVLHICLQRRIGRQFRWLRAAGGPFGVPLRGRRPAVQATAARGGVAAQLPRDRRGPPPQPAAPPPPSRRAPSRTPGPARDTARSPPAPRTTDTARRAASTRAQALLVACRPPPETTVSLPPAIHPRGTRRPPSPRPPRSPPRTAADPHAALPLADPATARHLARPDPSAASECPSRPLRPGVATTV